MNDEDARAVRGAYPGSVRRFAPFAVQAAASDAAPGGEAESAAGQLQEIIVTSQKPRRRHQGHPDQRIGDQRRAARRASCRRLRRHHPHGARHLVRRRPGTGSRQHRDSRRQLHVGIGDGRHLHRRGIGDHQQQPVRRRRAAEAVRSGSHRGAARSQGTLYGASSMGGTIRSSPSSRISIPSAPRRVPTCP